MLLVHASVHLRDGLHAVRLRLREIAHLGPVRLHIVELPVLGMAGDQFPLLSTTWTHSFGAAFLVAGLVILAGLAGYLFLHGRI